MTESEDIVDSRQGEGIMAWLTEPPTDAGLWFADDDGWTLHSYAELATGARRAATLLRDAGVAPGNTVLVICPNSPDFVAMFFGSLLCGATPAPVGMPGAFQTRDAYLTHVGRLLQLVAPAAVATTDKILQQFGGAADVMGIPVVTDSGTSALTLAEPAAPPFLGLLQFSSGSTALPKGVRISLRALNANVNTIREWVEWTPTDRLVSWLPFHHDMGLIGGLLAPMSQRRDNWIIRPDQFLRSPLRWLGAMSELRATVTPSPTFGLAHVLRKVRPEGLRGLDFSAWRTLIVGAERVDPGVLRDFTEFLAPQGFRRETLMPAYGLAEVTVGACGARPNTGWRSVTVDTASLSLGQPIRTGEPGAGSEIVGCGVPMPGMDLRIVDASGEPLPSGYFGEIEVSGPSLAQGYLGADDGGQFASGAFRTGDAGFVVDGELYVVGRLGDSLKRLGKWIFAEEIERVALELSPRPARTVLLLGTLEGRDTAVVVLEVLDEETAALIGKAMAKQPFDLHVELRRAPTGWIRRTTSGKPMRRRMWKQLLAEPDATEVLWHSHRTD
jgi:acyl-CoA synthetase (AMP-forming)/AMP-acid ligase II